MRNRNRFPKSGFARPGLRKLAVPPTPQLAASVVEYALVLLALLSGTVSFAQNPAPAKNSSPEPSSQVLVAGESVELRLTPGNSASLAFECHRGLYSEMRVQQVEGMNQSVLIDPDGHASMPRADDGGNGSVERIPLLSAKSGTFHLHIQPRERHRPIVVRVTLLRERAPLPQDSSIVQGEAALAEAEWVRRDRNSTSRPTSRSPADVAALYDHAEQLGLQAGDMTLAGECLIGKARYQIFRIAQYQQGVRTATQATQLLQSSPAIEQQGLAWKTLASALAFVNRYEESIAASDRALTLYEKTGDRYWQGILLGNLADTYREIGDTTKALQSAQGALRIAQQLSDDYGVAFTQSTIGEIYQGRGQYQYALNAYWAALNTLNKISYPQVYGEVWSNLGQLYVQLGDWERASNAYGNALPVLEKDGDVINEIAVLGHLGELALHSSHPRKAQAYFCKGLAQAESQQLLREETFLKIGLARACLRTRCAVDPLTTLSQARKSARQIHQLDGEAATDATIGDVLVLRDKNALAMHAYIESAGLWQRVPNAVELATVEADMARLDIRRGRLPAARQQIYAALNAIETSRADIDSDALRTSYFTSKRNYYGLAVEILMQMDRDRPGQGYAEEAWSIAERARARTLLDDLQEGHQDESSVFDRQLEQKVAAGDLQIHDTEDQLLALGSSPADMTHAEQLELKMRDLLQAGDRLKASMYASNPGYRAVAEASSISAAQFRRSVLDRNTALLEYWVGDAHSYLWVLTADGMRSFPLPNRVALDGAVHSYQKFMLARDTYVAGESIQGRQIRIRRSDASLAAESTKLATLLLPFRLGPRIRRLWIVGDGSLLSMPFAALPLPHSNTLSGPFLIQRYSLVYEPSAATMGTLLARRTQERGPARIAIFADPVYSATDDRVERASATPPPPSMQSPAMRLASFETLSQLPRLPGSRQEGLAIEQIAGATHTSLFLGFDASPKRIESMDWKRYTVAHFATHALVDTQHPEFSGIVLSMVDRHGSPADGVLWLHDIYRLPIPVSLVTLSGCQTADGQSVPGEGINGLSRAFLYAGAHSVIGTLWDSEDTSSSELMKSFYRALIGQHLAPVAALRSAQLQVLSDAEHHAPYYWAGFVLEGDGQGS